MSLRFDDDARHEYLEAIRFYGRAAERFVQAVDTAVAQIRGDPERFREIEQASEVAVSRNSHTRFFTRGTIKACSSLR
jgi:hypothetical protein